jgi:hypothetical protein
MKKYIILLLLLAACYDVPDIEYTIPAIVPVINFCYATGEIVVFGTTDPTDRSAIIYIDKYMTGIHLNSETYLESTPVDYGAGEMEIFFYTKPSALTGSCRYWKDMNTN